MAKRQATLLEFMSKPRSKGGSKPAKARRPSRVERRLVEPRIGGFTLASNRDDVDETPPAYLMAVYYDGEAGCAVAALYDDSENKVYLWRDKTGHKSYFLTDLTVREVSRIAAIVKHPSFERLETVKKYDLLMGEEREFTKIVVKDPQAVAELRDKVPKAWEARIKYHNNYIYDLGLIPGMKYVATKTGLVSKKPELTEEQRRQILELFKDEDEETQKLALEWMPLFEEPPPRMPRLAIDIEVYTPFRGRVPDPDTASYPVISAALYSNDGYKRVLVLARDMVWGEPGDNYPVDADIEVFDDEKALIMEIFRVMEKYPLILTFNGDNFDLNYLYTRALKLGIPREYIPIRWVQDYATLRKGFHIDLYKFFQIRALQAYAFGGKYKQFTLDAIASALLGVGKVEVEGSISDLTVSDLASYNYRDAKITLELTTFNGELVWKLIVLLMRISKLGIEDVTRSQVSAWIRNLFYWEHRRRGYLIPLREDIKLLKGATKSAAIIKGKKYAGAVVLDPPEGVFFDVVVLDFASLYPSIIKTWNLSYETINPERCREDKLVEIPEVGHKVCMDRPGITAQMTGLLRDFRVKIYKKKAKDPSIKGEEKSWYQVVEKAMKVYINASYGVFGAENFPLYAPPLAESVTAMGRHVIRSTVEKSRELGLIVLYGDSVTKDAQVWVRDGNTERRVRIEELFHRIDFKVDGKEYYYPENLYTLTVDREGRPVYRRIKYVMRHRVSKRIYRVWVSKELYIDVTEDHSIMTYKGENEKCTDFLHCLAEAKPAELRESMYLVCLETHGDGRRTVLRNPLKVEEIRYDDYVYDLEVEDTHMFFANEILVHNTDSLFLWHPDKERLMKLRDWVLEKFGLELDLDKVYRYVAFSGRKKNYVGIYPDGSVEVKGMMGKKRNTPQFLKQAFQEVLDELSSVHTPEDFAKVKDNIKNRLRDILNRLRKKGYTLDQLTFHVALSKPIRAYNKNLPQHVKAALYLVKHGIEIMPGDTIVYVKVTGRDGAKPIQLAKLAEIDVKKYEEHVKSTFEQILAAIGLTWDEVEGARTLDLLGLGFGG